MEPRPSRPSRTTGQPSTKTTRTPWTPSPTVEPPPSQRTADIYSAPPSQSSGQWYGQQPTYAPDPADYRQTGPMTPIKPRGERGNKLLRYLLAALLLIGVIGGGAYLVTRFLGSNDKPENPPVAAVTGEGVTPTPTAAQPAEAQQSAPTPTTAAPTVTTAAAQPTERPTDAPVQAAGAEATPAAGGDTAAGSAEAWLPDVSDLEGEWTVTDEGQRTKTEVAAAIGANGDELLTSWRWRENYFREMTRVDPQSFPRETTFVSVSVHRFENAEGAAEALTALSDIVVEAQGLQDVETPVIGDKARGLAGPGDGVNLYVLYVQDGEYLLRLGGSSVTGDPSVTINTLAQQMVTKQGTAA